MCHVVMQGLRPCETAARAHSDECHAVWSQPLQYLYVMTFGAVSERTAFLADIHAPAPPLPPPPATPPGGSQTSGGDGEAGSTARGRREVGDAASVRAEHSMLLRDAMLEARRKSREDARDVVEGGALTGRLVAAGTALALIVALRSPRAPLPDSFRDASSANFSAMRPGDSQNGSASAARFAAPRPRAKRFLWGNVPRSDVGNHSLSLSLSLSFNVSDSGATPSPEWSAAPRLDAGVSNGSAAFFAAQVYRPLCMRYIGRPVYRVCMSHGGI
jgi:hypothetical protein